MKISTRITGAFLLVLVAIVILAWTYHSNLERINDTRKWVEHTLEVIIEKETLESSLKDLESRSRAYAATGNEKFLDGTEELRQKIERGFNNLKSLTLDNPDQQQNLKQLSPLISKRIEQLNVLVQARKDGSKDVLSNIRLPESGATWSWISVSDRIKAEEERLLKARTDATVKSIEETESLVVFVTAATLLLVGAIGFYLVNGLGKSIAELISGTDRVAKGDVDFHIQLPTKDELGALAKAFNLMIERLRELSESQAGVIWHRQNINHLAVALEGQRHVDKAADLFLQHLAPLMGAHQAVLYAVRDQEHVDQLDLVGAFGADQAGSLPKNMSLGDGLIGQCAKDQTKLILRDVHPDSFVIKSALTVSKPLEVAIIPLVFEGETQGVLEMASVNGFSEKQNAYIDEVCERMGLMLNSIYVAMKVDQLLKDSQMMVEELQSQQEELESQQDELRSVNEELEEKAEALDLQNQEITDKNLELEQMQLQLEEKANELAMASKYKSNFLANMSHDLRTPLNSLMIFSELLAENDENNLQDFQVDYAKNIHAAGKTLLSLIDDILDLSKIESGTVTLDVVPIFVSDIIDEMKRNFQLPAEGKNLQFDIRVDPDSCDSIQTDRKRLSQLLVNLLNNAFKFTEAGYVRLEVKPATIEGDGYDGKEGIAFVVSDTGIGISPDKQEQVFEAFRQADETIKKKYGGTGLGLAICRQLSELLGGYVRLESEPKKGSTFTVVLPLVYQGRRDRRIDGASIAATFRTLERSIEVTKDLKILMQTEIDDDRRSLEPDDRVLLMVEDDPAFARMLLDMARKHSFKGVVALTGGEGLALARKLVPDGITLDLKLPDMEGWVVLDQLKNSAETRHIPVHIISVEQERRRSLEAGAIGLLEKPVTVSSLTDAINRIKNLIAREEGKILLVEHDKLLREKLCDMLSDKSVKVSSVASGKEALAALDAEGADCVIVDINLDDIKGTELIEQIQKRSDTIKPPVLVYSNRQLTDGEKTTLNRLRRSSVVRDVDSPERLLNEALLFLHRVEASLPEAKRRILATVRQLELPLVGRKILIVDDDPRNIAAMTGALQKQQMTLLYAENGREAIDMLEKNPDVELVLLDMMMPVMDGYEAMTTIRRTDKFGKLPIIAVTAKAMKEDRRKCLEAGASDYISKPVDRSQLLSLLKVWLYKR